MRDETQLMAARAKELADQLRRESEEAAPTAIYAKAKIAALEIASENGGQIAPNIRPVGEACQSLARPGLGREMLLREIGENMFNLTPLGQAVVEALRVSA